MGQRAGLGRTASALSYRHTGNPEYVRLFEEVTGYFLDHLPHSLVPYWDFIFQDGSMEPRDSLCGGGRGLRYAGDGEISAGGEGLVPYQEVPAG